MGLFTPINFYRTRGVLGPVLPNIDQTNLLRWFDADFDASSSSWVDQTGTQDANVSGPSLITTASPYYYDFPGGSGNEIGNPNTETSDLSLSSMVIQVWARHATNNNSNFAIVSQRSVVGSAGVRYSIHCNPSNNTVGIYNGYGFNTTSVTQSAGNWYFFEFIITDRATGGKLTVYLNNSLIGSTAANTGLNTTAGDEPFGIGTPNYGYTTYSGEFWNGDIAMCLVYSGSTRPTGNWDATKSRFGY